MRSIRALELVRSRRSLILEFVTPVDSKSTVPRDLEARARGHLVLRAPPLRAPEARLGGRAHDRERHLAGGQVPWTPDSGLDMDLGSEMQT